MSDLLFTCSVCSKHLAVNVSLLGRRFICPECQTKIHAPDPNLIFRCPVCACDLAAPAKLAMQMFDCPNCEQVIPIPEFSTVSCPACRVNIEMEEDDYDALAGKTLSCPECAETVPVPALPRSEAEAQTGAPDDAPLLPKGFGHKTMKLDSLITGIPQAERLNHGICPYCSAKVHVLHGGSYVCKACGRIMRMANKPPKGSVTT